jgi:endonuclease III
LSTLAIREAVERLHEFYGPLVPPPRDPFALYVWEVLDFHTSPLRRDAALAALRRIPALTPDSVAKAVPKKLEAAVMLAGPYHDERIRALRGGAEFFRRHPETPARIAGPLRAARRALRAFPQLGLVGAHRMLLFASEQPVIPADPHLTRVAVRLGYGAPTPNVRLQIRRVRRALSTGLVPDPETVRRAVLYLSHHGSATCQEHDPHCHVCPLRPDCPYAGARETDQEPR